jgi:beta-glucanase (GH16 family)
VKLSRRLVRTFLIPALLCAVVLADPSALARAEAQPPAGNIDLPPPPPLPPKPALVDPAKDPAWEITFRDEFRGTKLDRTKWIDSYPGGERTHSNNEQQFYATDGWEVRNGRLRFKAEKRKKGSMPYTSGMVSSFGKFSQKYGWFEIRARFPKGKGMWPAFWLLPITRDWPPEIDILEILGHETDKVYFSTHFNNAAGKHEYKTGNWKGPDFAADYHVFAVDWQPGLCIWYVDGVERYRSTTGVSAEPMYILANLAVGGDWPGMPDALTPFPGYMDIDYIRVYRRKATQAQPPIPGPLRLPPPPLPLNLLLQ